MKFNDISNKSDNTPDYKKLFYYSQAKIADIIDVLDRMSDTLKRFMEECENEVISETENNCEQKNIIKKDRN